MEFTLSAVAPLPAGANIAVFRPAAKRARSAALRAGRIERIRAHIDANLADPTLSAQAAARALGMSVRSLHLALAPLGEPFGQLVQRRRLAACHALLRHGDDGATVTDIAFAGGFNSLSSFYRAFRRVYGSRPRQCALATTRRAA